MGHDVSDCFQIIGYPPNWGRDEALREFEEEEEELLEEEAGELKLGDIEQQELGQIRVNGQEKETSTVEPIWF